MKTTINLTLTLVLSMLLFTNCGKEEAVEKKSNDMETYTEYQTSSGETIRIPESMEIDEENLNALLESFNSSDDYSSDNSKTSYYPIALGVTKHSSVRVGREHCYTYFHQKTFDANVKLEVNSKYSGGRAYCYWYHKSKGTTSFTLVHSATLTSGAVSYTKFLGKKQGTQYEKFRVCIVGSQPNSGNRFYYSVSCSF